MEKNSKVQNCKYKYKVIYSLRIRIELQQKGFEPIMELINQYNPHFKCWRYIDSPEFEQALNEIRTGGREDG